MFKFLRSFNALIAAVMLVSLFISPALAATEDIDLDPDEGEIGEYIDITGEDFYPSSTDEPPYTYSEVDIYFSHSLHAPSLASFYFLSS